MSLLTAIRTKKANDELIEKIDRLLLAVYSAGGKHHLVLPEEIKEEIVKQKVNLPSRQDLAEWLQNLRGKLAKLPIMGLTVARPLSTAGFDAAIKSLEKSHFLAIIDLKVDKNLIGGATLSYKGIYKDYSLRKKLEKDIL